MTEEEIGKMVVDAINNGIKVEMMEHKGFTCEMTAYSTPDPDRPGFPKIVIVPRQMLDEWINDHENCDDPNCSCHRKTKGERVDVP